MSAWRPYPPGKAGRYSKWCKPADSPREEYLEAFDYLRPEFDMVLAEITQPML